MIPKTPFQQFLPGRIRQARHRLEQSIWTVDSTPLDVFQSEPTAAHCPLAEANTLTYHPVTRRPHVWGQMFDQCWWQVNLPTAPNRPSVPRYLVWKDQAEATVYHQGQAYFGFDPAHHHCVMPQGVHTLQVESACCRTGTWVQGQSQGISEQGSVFEGAYLAYRDDDAWHAFHDVDVCLRVADMLHQQASPLDQTVCMSWGHRAAIEEVSPIFRVIIQQLDRAVDVLDRQGPGAMRQALKQLFEQLRPGFSTMQAVLTGHAHIDLVWLWPERVGEFKAVHSLANALRVQDQYPEVHFGYSQPASYEAVDRRCPELIQRVRERIDEGRWDATGAMYVESDTQLACGEGLVRAFAVGQAGFADLRRDAGSRTVWLPDVFGYSGVIPTIMAGFGVPYFYTTKLHWSSAQKFPYSSFIWTGHDGSQVIGHIGWEGYNHESMPEQIQQAGATHRQAGVHDQVLMPTGYGDGGGGVTQAICERARRLTHFATLPRVAWGGIETFFDRLAQEKEHLPQWRGEMYLEYHRGVQTTQARLKALFRGVERALQTWEAVRCAKAAGPIDLQAWKRIILAQFHDYIPGSSIEEVYHEHLPELEQLESDSLRHAQAELDHGTHDAVFNPLPMRRSHRVDHRLYDLPALAGTILDPAQARTAKPVHVDLEQRVMANEHVHVRFTDTGEIDQMTIDGHPIAWVQPAGQLWSFPDHPADFDAWDIDRQTLSNGHHHDTPCSISTDLADPYAPALCFARHLPGVGQVVTRYTLETESSLLRIALDIDLAEPQILLKITFPTAYTGRHARFGAPFGSALRPQQPGTLGADAMFETPASRWACVADDGEKDGLMIITQAKYGLGAHAGLLHLSLIRSPRFSQPNGQGDGQSDLCEGRTLYSDLGPHTVHLAIGRYTAHASRDHNPAALADTLFTPAIPYQGSACSAGLLEIEGGPSLVPAWGQPHEPGGGWTLRAHETLGHRGEAVLRLADGYQAVATDLRGQPLRDVPLPTDRIPYGPYQVMSFHVTPSG